MTKNPPKSALNDPRWRDEIEGGQAAADTVVGKVSDTDKILLHTKAAAAEALPTEVEAPPIALNLNTAPLKQKGRPSFFGSMRTKVAAAIVGTIGVTGGIIAVAGMANSGATEKNAKPKVADVRTDAIAATPPPAAVKAAPTPEKIAVVQPAPKVGPDGKTDAQRAERLNSFAAMATTSDAEPAAAPKPEPKPQPTFVPASPKQPLQVAQVPTNPTVGQIAASSDARTSVVTPSIAKPFKPVFNPDDSETQAIIEKRRAELLDGFKASAVFKSVVNEPNVARKFRVMASALFNEASEMNNLAPVELWAYAKMLEKVSLPNGIPDVEVLYYIDVLKARAMGTSVSEVTSRYAQEYNPTKPSNSDADQKLQALPLSEKARLSFATSLLEKARQELQNGDTTAAEATRAKVLLVLNGSSNADVQRASLKQLTEDIKAANVAAQKRAAIEEARVALQVNSKDMKALGIVTQDLFAKGQHMEALQLANNAGVFGENIHIAVPSTLSEKLKSIAGLEELLANKKFSTYGTGIREVLITHIKAALAEAETTSVRKKLSDQLASHTRQAPATSVSQAQTPPKVVEKKPPTVVKTEQPRTEARPEEKVNVSITDLKINWRKLNAYFEPTVNSMPPEFDGKMPIDGNHKEISDYIFAATPAEATIDVPAGTRNFTATLIMETPISDSDGVIFVFYADGREIFSSGVFHGRKDIKIPLDKSVKKMSFVIHQNKNDRADHPFIVNGKFSN